VNDRVQALVHGLPGPVPSARRRADDPPASLSDSSAAGYVKVRKGYVGKRPRTWLSLTTAGRDAFAAHVAALQRIVEQAGATLTPQP
jgi:hypothetical protein